MAKFSRDGKIDRGDVVKSEQVHSPAPLVSDMSRAARPVPIRDGILAKLFPTAEERAIARARLELIEANGEFMKEALILSRKTQLASLQETCDLYITRQRVEVRQQIATHILSEKQKLMTNLNQITNEFMVEMEEQMRYAEGIEREFFRNTRLQQLEADFIEFVNLQDSLLERFRRSLPESV
jgi:hypothetical protein